MKKFFALLTAVLMLVMMCGCQLITDTVMPADDAGVNEITSGDDIIILFTNDVHCSTDGVIGYDGIAAYKKYAESKSEYVTLIDAGDHIQGSYLGAVSRGGLFVEIMNTVGYDYSAIGNHEFDYGMDRLAELMSMADYQYLCCNLSYTGKGEYKLEEYVRPYALEEYGDTTVGFVGVTTPLSIANSTPAYFQEDGEYAYDLCADGTGQLLWNTVQSAVDECRKAGADYVVVVSHLGEEEVSQPYTSQELVKNTNGIDALIDAHSHAFVSCRIVSNKDGEEVLTAQTGTGLNAIGQLIITRSGSLMMGCISEYGEKDPAVTSEIGNLSAEYEEMMNEVVAHSEQSLSVSDANGIRLVRSRETGLGDLCSDALRAASGADIAYINGGGVRADLPAGDITYRNIIDVHPFGNMMCTMELKGSEILDMLEYFCRTADSDYVRDGNAYGEDGNFPCMSGMRFTIDTSVPSSVTVDENDMLVSVDGPRRVSDVAVLKDGEYVSLDPDAVYTFAAADYCLKKGGNGMELFLSGREVLNDSFAPDYSVLIDYMKSLDDLSAYYEPDGRITIR